MVHSILAPGYLRWDGSKFTTDPSVMIIGPAGPQGPPGSDADGYITNWQSYTPIFNTVNNDAALNSATISGKWRISQDSIEIMFIINVSDDINWGSGNLLINLPQPSTQINIDTSKCLLGPDGYYHLIFNIAAGLKDPMAAIIIGINDTLAFDISENQYDAFNIDSSFIDGRISGDMVIVTGTIPYMLAE